MKPSDLTVTDLFCGAGGSSQGATTAGLRLRLALNHWPRAIETHNTNFPQADHVCEDIMDMPTLRVRRLQSTHVLIASPECTNHSQARSKKCSRATERHYATMSLEEICALDVPATSDSLLFLWSTAPMLEGALRVMRAWGFSYRTSIVWCKDRMGTGAWVRSQHELLLLGRRGDFPAPSLGTQPRSVIHARRGAHSEKPDEVHAMIERTYPGRRYLELFARRQRDGWTTWGNDPALD